MDSSFVEIPYKTVIVDNNSYHGSLSQEWLDGTYLFLIYHAMLNQLINNPLPVFRGVLGSFRNSLQLGGTEWKRNISG